MEKLVIPYSNILYQLQELLLYYNSFYPLLKFYTVLTF